MAARMDFFRLFPNEAHIFFDALLNPPDHLAEDIQQALAEFNQLNEKIYSEKLDKLDSTGRSIQSRCCFLFSLDSAHVKWIFQQSRFSEHSTAGKDGDTRKAPTKNL